MFIIRPELNVRLITKSTHGKIMKMLMRELMVWHIQYVLPRHFENGAENVYHYFRRTKKYLDAKLRKWGHQRPNVWSGQTEREIRETEPVVTATQYQSRMYYRFHWQRTGKRQENKPKVMRSQPSGGDGRTGTVQRKIEIEKVLIREVQEKSRWLARRYAQECNKPTNRRLRRFRS